MNRVPPPSFARLYGRSLVVTAGLSALIGGVLLLLPLRRLAEPGVAFLLDVVLSGRHRRWHDHYVYDPDHYPWAVGLLVLFCLLLLVAVVYGMAYARADDRRLVRHLENRLDEQTASNTRKLNDT